MSKRIPPAPGTSAWLIADSNHRPHPHTGLPPEGEVTGIITPTALKFQISGRPEIYNYLFYND